MPRRGLSLAVVPVNCEDWQIQIQEYFYWYSLASALEYISYGDF